MPKPNQNKPPRGLRSSPQKENEGGITDPRFANIQTSALYRLPSKKQTHVKLDSRFTHMLRDDRFASRSKTDRYGRRLGASKGENELTRLYRTKGEGAHDSGSEGVDDAPDDDDEVQKELERVTVKYDPARDGGFSESSSEDEASDREEAELEQERISFPEQQSKDTPGGEVSARLAVVNLDWDNVRAIDLLAVFQSFVPKGESILSVCVYPSQFGKERMQREEREGPPQDIFVMGTGSNIQGDERNLSPENDEDAHFNEHDEQERIKRSIVKENGGEEFNATRLRMYQLERLRYYYGVLTCSSASCGKAIYNAVDGTEYQSTANFFDLRFIPDEMDFLEDKPRDECERLPDNYRPNDFVTDALQHSRVKLTWDADNVERKEAQQRAFSGGQAGIDDNDLKAYLASDSSDEDDNPVNLEEAASSQEMRLSSQSNAAIKGNDRRKMRTLLGFDDKYQAQHSKGFAPVGDMQITFTSGLSGPQLESGFENAPAMDETSADKYTRKARERKAKRRDKMRKAREQNGTDAAELSSQSQLVANDDQPDLGFDDSFFTAPMNEKATTKQHSKLGKRHARTTTKAGDQESMASAELEPLMTTSKTDKRGINHFDMQDIERAERKSKGKRIKKLSTRDRHALEAKSRDNFAINLQDPRFNAIYDRSEFAVDPSHPRYKETGGMKALLQESRSKRARREVEVEHEMALRKRRKHESETSNEELGKLAKKARVRSLKHPS